MRSRSGASNFIKASRRDGGNDAVMWLRPLSLVDRILNMSLLRRSIRPLT